MRIAYLINQYPQTSHSFIRREIEALEASGTEVLRYTVRPVKQPLVDPGDEAERQKTRAVLAVGPIGLALGLLKMAVTRPRAFVQASKLAIRFGKPSERGLIVHLIYLAEACVLTGWLEEARVEHVHAHFGTNSTTIAALCRALGGPPFSFTVHGPEEFDSPRALALGEKVRWASFVCGISEFTRSQLYRWADHADWPKVHVVRCGLDPSYLGGQGPIAARESRRLICVGRLVEQKGPLLLVEAAGKLRDRGVDFELILVGDGPMRGEVERLIERLKLGDRVKLAGWMSKAEVRQALIESRAMVLPSFAEGLPVVLMEALALGRPVITTYVAGIPELVTPGETGWLVPAGSLDDLVEAMARAMAASTEELERMGRIGSSRVAARHDARIEAGKIAGLIRGAGQARPAVFLDRDGTVIEHVHYIGDPAQVRLLPEVGPALRRFQEAGFALVVVTNQSAIGRGFITVEQYEQVNAEMIRQLAGEGVTIGAVYYCPEAPSGDDRTAVTHEDRKPGPGMLKRGARDLGLDLSTSWMIGDMISDALAGINAGCRGTFLVETGKELLREEAQAVPGLVVVPHLSAAADVILGATAESANSRDARP